MNRNEVIAFLLGVAFGILLAVAFVSIVNEMRFRTSCDGKVLSDSWGRNYCINPDQIINP